MLALNAGYVGLLNRTLDQFAAITFHEGNRAEGYVVPSVLPLLFALIIGRLTCWVATHRALRRVVQSAKFKPARS